jgi:hypothetical protein
MGPFNLDIPFIGWLGPTKINRAILLSLSNLEYPESSSARAFGPHNQDSEINQTKSTRARNAATLAYADDTGCGRSRYRSRVVDSLVSKKRS